jgi:predicted transcriptional regulator YheO
VFGFISISVFAQDTGNKNDKDKTITLPAITVTTPVSLDFAKLFETEADTKSDTNTVAPTNVYCKQIKDPRDGSIQIICYNLNVSFEDMKELMKAVQQTQDTNKVAEPINESAPDK